MGKTVVIENTTHELLKEYCNDNSIKLNAWVDNLIKEKIEEIHELSKNIQRNSKPR
jgi:predicted HicB family RNase H-like nuclease